MKSIFPFSGLLALSISVVLVGCLSGKKANVVSIAEGEAFILPFGKTALLKDKDLRLTFSEVLEDSRCPLYSNCIWEGQVRIKIEVENFGEKAALEFTRRGKENEPLVQKVKGFQVKLLMVVPYPEAGKTVKQESYSVKLLVD